MKIGFIGAGVVAQSIARSALLAGHDVMLSSRRGPEVLKALTSGLGERASAVTLDEAAAQDVVILAVPWRQVEASLSELPMWHGRILVDATNHFIQVSPTALLADLGGVGASDIVAGFAPGARVVKAFNSIRMSDYNKGPRVGQARRMLFISGDYPAANSRVRALIETFGFAVVDLGALAAGGVVQQAGGPVAGREILLAD